MGSLGVGLAGDGGLVSGVAALPAIDIRQAPYNAILDRASVSDGNITSGTNVLTTTTSAPFALTDVGKAISVANAGGNPAGELRTTISAFVGSASVTLAANATRTVSSRTVTNAVTNGTTTVTMPDTSQTTFVAGDAGAAVTGTNIPAYTVIASVTNSTTIVLSQPAMDSAAGGTLFIAVGVQFGTDLLTPLNNALAALAPLGGIIQIPGWGVMSQAARIGIDGQTTRSTIILQGSGSRNSGIAWINSNSLGFIQALGTGANTQIPQIVRRDLGFDGLYRGVGTDGIFNRVGSATFDQLPYPFSSKSVAPFPAGTHGNAYEQSSANYGRTVNDCVTNGTTTITSATAAFVQGNDAGKAAQGTNIPVNTTIASVTNGTTAVLSQAAIGSGTGLLTLGPATLTDAGRTVADGVTNGTATITSATLGFTDGSVGRTITGSADIPGGTTIASVTNATTAIMSAAATGSHAAQTFTLGPPVWTLNQWKDALVFVDEDKAAANSVTGSGYGRVVGNTTTGIVQVGTWYGTKKNSAFQLSGAVVRYRFQLDNFRGVHHRWEHCYFYRPHGFVTFPSRGEFIYPVIESAGQPGASVHNDSFGTAGQHLILDHPKYINCAGNLVDAAAVTPGIFPTIVFTYAEDVGRLGAGGVFALGVGSRIVGLNIDDPSQTGIGYDATTVQPNRGGNVVEANTGSFIQGYVSGASGLAGDTLYGNVLNDAPLVQSGTLPSVTLSSGVGAQVSTNREVNLAVSVTATLAAGTLKVELSPDNVTYTTLTTANPGVVGGVDLVTLRVPAGWYVKLTDTNVTHTAVYY